MHSNDVKIVLCENYCLTDIFARTVKLIKKNKKMSSVNKLQLVDGGKLSAVLELIKKDMEMKKMLNTLENPNNLTIEEK